MYGWIWRHLPFGRPGRIVGSVLLATATGLLLWFLVFPLADELLPFGDVQVSQQKDQRGGNVPSVAPTVGRTPTINPSDFVVQYPTGYNRTAPSTPARR